MGKSRTCQNWLETKIIGLWEIYCSWAEVGKSNFYKSFDLKLGQNYELHTDWKQHVSPEAWEYDKS